MLKAEGSGRVFGGSFRIPIEDETETQPSETERTERVRPGGGRASLASLSRGFFSIPKKGGKGGIALQKPGALLGLI
jgi:hypothetical protein